MPVLTIPTDTDSTQQLRRALAAGPVTLSTFGEYRVSGQIAVQSGSRLYGASSLIRATRAIPGGVFVPANGAEDIEINDVTVDAGQSHYAIRPVGDASGIRLNNVTLRGDVNKTKTLVEFGPGVSDITLSDVVASQAMTLVRIHGDVRNVFVARFRGSQWKNYGVEMRITDEAPRQVVLSDCEFRKPAAGTSRNARQAIVAYANEDTDARVRFLWIVQCKVYGDGLPWDRTATNTTASGDQIALHYCEDFTMSGCESHGGGEIGATVARRCKRGTISHCKFYGADGHGLQIGSADDTEKYRLDTEDISVLECEFVGCGIGADGKNEKRVMAGIHVQNALRTKVGRCHINDELQRLRCGVLFADSKDHEYWSITANRTTTVIVNESKK